MSAPKGKFFWTNLAKPKDGKLKDDGKIEIKTSGQTHVYRKTSDDAKVQANSPYYFRKMKGDFECTVKIAPKCKLDTWLDQVGILVQEKRGIYAKIGLEYQKPPREDDLQHYVAAYIHNQETLEHEKEATTPYPGQFSKGDKNYACEKLQEGQHKELWLRLSRLEGFVDAEYSLDGEEWKELKAGKFSSTEQLSVGVFSSSPGGGNVGFKAVLSDFTIEQTEYCEDDDDDSDGEEPSLENEE